MFKVWLRNSGHRATGKRLTLIGIATLSACLLGASGDIRVGHVQPIRSAEAAGVATHLAFISQPTSTSRGAAFPNQPAIAVEDAQDSIDTSDNSTLVTLPSGLSCTGGLTRQVVNGVAAFMGCTTKQPSIPQFGFTFQATSNTGLTPATSDTFYMTDASHDLPGLLHVTTSPGVPSQVQVNGVPMDDWALNWVKLPPGLYTVSFSELQGFTTPAPQTVTVTAGQTTTVQGVFVQRGNLRVVTSPPVPSTITLDGIPRNDWGLWTDLPAGSYQVCFGAVAGFNVPGCQTANVTAGQQTVITGTFTANAGAQGPAAGYGLLRVTTSPAVPAQVLVNGVPMTDWGLDWVKMAPGTYTVSFTNIPNFTSPPPQVVTVTAGQTTTVNGSYLQRGFLRVITSPAVVGTIIVNGLPRDDWGMWTSVDPGSYQVCFGPAVGFSPVACQTEIVNAAALSTVTGSYGGLACTPSPGTTYSISGSGPVAAVFATADLDPASFNVCEGEVVVVTLHLKVAASAVSVIFYPGSGVDAWETAASPTDDTHLVWTAGAIWPGGASFHGFDAIATYGQPAQAVTLGIRLCTNDPCS